MLAFLEHLADWSTGVPLLLLCTARPELHEKHPTWAAGVRNAQTINLAPLSDDETATLIALLLKRTVLPRQRPEQPCSTAPAATPLYAEEFVRLLSDRNLLGNSTRGRCSVPDSVQALIAARWTRSQRIARAATQERRGDRQGLLGRSGLARMS